jgi:hypothetical protein
MIILWEEMEKQDMVLTLAIIVALAIFMPQTFAILVLSIIIGTFMLFM